MKTTFDIGLDFKQVIFGTLFLNERTHYTFGIFFLWLYITYKLPKLKSRNVQVIKTQHTNTISINREIYFIEAHPTFNPKCIYVRERKTAEIVKCTNFKIVESETFNGALVYIGRNIRPEYYLTDEFYYTLPNTNIKGYIDDGRFILLSIVD